MKEKIICNRLLIRPLSKKELEQIERGRQDFLAESILTEEIKAAIENKIGQMKRLPKSAHPWVTYWLILEKESGFGVGLIGSKSLPDADGYVELGYIVAKEYQNNGYMTEALLGFLDWLYGWPFCSGAMLSIRSTNEPSLKVADKCGFRFERQKENFSIYRYDF